MHIPQTFHFIVKNCFNSKLPQLCGATHQPQHILFKNYDNCHRCITYLSLFYHLLTQRLPHYHLHLLFQIITAYISFPSSTASLHPVLTSCSQHTSIIFFLCSSQISPPIPHRPPKLHVPTRTQKRPLGLSSDCKLCLPVPGCGAPPTFS